MQGLTIQTRIPLAEATGEQQKKKKDGSTKPNLRLLNGEKDQNPLKCVDPLRRNGRRRANVLGTVMLGPLPDHWAKAEVRATRVSRRGKAKGRTPRVKVVRLLMCGTAPTYVARTGRVTRVDGMSAGEHFGIVYRPESTREIGTV